MLYHLFNFIFNVIWVFLGFVKCRDPLLFKKTVGILSPTPPTTPFPLKERTLAQPLLVPETWELIFRSKLTLNSGPQLVIVPISVFLLTIPDRPKMITLLTCEVEVRYLLVVTWSSTWQVFIHNLSTSLLSNLQIWFLRHKFFFSKTCLNSKHPLNILKEAVKQWIKNCGASSIL